MPGICFLRNARARTALWRSHLETVLDRDLDLIVSSKLSFQKKESLLRLLYEDPGRPKDYAFLSRKIGSSQPTMKALVNAFEGLFLLRRHGPYYFPEDHGLAYTLAPSALSDPFNRLLRHVYNRLLAMTHYEMRGDVRLEHFHTKGGSEVHFVIRSESVTWGFAVDAGPGASEKSLKSLGSLARQTKNTFIPCVIHLGENAYLSSKSVPCLPWTWL